MVPGEPGDSQEGEPRQVLAANAQQRRPDEGEDHDEDREGQQRSQLRETPRVDAVVEPEARATRLSAHSAAAVAASA